MKVLFVMRNSGNTRNWEWVIRNLAERGHSVHVGFELERPQAEVAERLADEFPNVTYGYVPLRRDGWWPLLQRIRSSIDYLRYLGPEYRDADKLRARGRRHVPGLVALLVKLPPLRGARGRRGLNRVLRACERAVPRDQRIDAFIKTLGADVVMATPLVGGDSQHDYLFGARALGRFTVLPVTSWDNLTTKGLVRVVPDRVYVWNETQRREAIEMHGLPPDRIVAVGAHSYDHWFSWRPTWTRAEFARRAGLDPERPYLLYVCSSKFISGDERPVVARWVERIRADSDPLLKDVGILVRPHPGNPCWEEENPLEGLPNTSVWPRHGSDPRNLEARSEYYDSIYHSAGVVGINTTALIEAAIVGRRTFTVLLPELRATQGGTLHFHYLLRENGGPLTVAGSPDEHTEQLRRTLREPEPPGWNRAFLESFVRPRGLDTASAPRLVDDLESAVGAFSAEPPERSPYLLRGILYPLAFVSRVSLMIRRLRRSRPLANAASVISRRRDERPADERTAPQRDSAVR